MQQRNARKLQQHWKERKRAWVKQMRREERREETREEGRESREGQIDTECSLNSTMQEAYLTSQKSPQATRSEDRDRQTEWFRRSSQLG